MGGVRGPLCSCVRCVGTTAGLGEPEGHGRGPPRRRRRRAARRPLRRGTRRNTGIRFAWLSPSVLRSRSHMPTLRSLSASRPEKINRLAISEAAQPLCLTSAKDPRSLPGSLADDRSNRRTRNTRQQFFGKDGGTPCDWSVRRGVLLGGRTATRGGTWPPSRWLLVAPRGSPQVRKPSLAAQHHPRG